MMHLHQQGAVGVWRDKQSEPVSGQIGKQASWDLGERIGLSLSCLFLVHKTAFI